ncbi:unnamed protein product, partial [Effrenium voratum]
LGVSVSDNLASLKNTQLLFFNSHYGIIQGAAWAGVPVLNKLCTVHQMREVSFNFEEFLPLILEILNAETLPSSQQTALGLAWNISDKSGPLFASMVAAVTLYVNDQGECDPSQDMTPQGWQRLMLEAGNGYLYGQQAFAQYMQIGTMTQTSSSQTALTVVTSSITEAVNGLVQGYKARNLPAPPSQTALDGLLRWKSTWEELEPNLELAVRLGATTVVQVRLVLRLLTSFKSEAESVIELFLANALAAQIDVPIYQIKQATFQQLGGASAHGANGNASRVRVKCKFKLLCW